MGLQLLDRVRACERQYAVHPGLPGRYVDLAGTLLFPRWETRSRFCHTLRHLQGEWLQTECPIQRVRIEHDVYFQLALDVLGPVTIEVIKTVFIVRLFH